jgi:hypothetical protein
MSIHTKRGLHVRVTQLLLQNCQRHGCLGQFRCKAVTMDSRLRIQRRSFGSVEGCATRPPVMLRVLVLDLIATMLRRDTEYPI